MKNYDTTNNLTNKELRSQWIKKHSDFVLDLPPQCKMIMLILYHIRSFSNLNKKLSFFQVTYAVVSKYMNLLSEIGFIKIDAMGRLKRYSITNSGNNFCIELFERFNQINAKNRTKFLKENKGVTK